LERKSEIENLKYPKGLKNRILVMLNKTGHSEICFLRESKEMGEKRTAFSTLTKNSKIFCMLTRTPKILSSLHPRTQALGFK
jgi:hypothetical protein